MAIEHLAQRKAQALVESEAFKALHPALVISADTLVAFENEVLGKPKDQNDAFLTLQRLSGKQHRVLTGYCLWNSHNGEVVLGHSVSVVEFRKLSDEEIWEYVKSGDPMDKAGSYGIQSLARQLIQREHQQLAEAEGQELGSTFRYKGQDFVKSFTGSLENIAGLPVEEIEEKLKQLGWELPRKV